MPVEVELRGPSSSGSRKRRPPDASAPIVVGLVNNMPDAALDATESQFRGLLSEAAGARRVALRLSHLGGLPRGGPAREALQRRYWPLDDLLSDPLDAVIVTGTEPRARSLREEPYWSGLVEILAWAESHTASSIWSCLAAHAAVLQLDGIERRRLPEKLCGVFSHSVAQHPLTAGVSAPLDTPHSRWNGLASDELEGAGYQILSESPQSGANAFVKQHRSLLVFFQGHPEYEASTLLQEYRRDVRRFLKGRIERYPSLPSNYLAEDAALPLHSFANAARAGRHDLRPEAFPFEAVAARVVPSWRSASVRIYDNWLSYLVTHRSAA